MSDSAATMMSRSARIAVVNRGDASVRFIQAVREYNLEHGTRFQTIACYTEPDRGSWAVRLADESVLLGPARIRDAATGQQTHTYLDLERLSAALRSAQVDAAWVGWGFVSERAAFAELCRELGITFIGPRPETIRLLGDKIGAKRLAESAGVAVSPWSGGPVAELDDAAGAARQLGYPLLVKAAAGGGGRGIRSVADESGLQAAWEAVRAEARSAFGDPTVFLETQLNRARHLEVQIAGDHAGNVWAIGLRDCTVQRRRQKILEESGAHGLDAAQQRRIADAARSIVSAAGYTGVGTVEFLLDLATGTPYFMEVNPRLQVEHGVTELTAGLDLVKLQLDLAAGAVLGTAEPVESGHAIEARLTAEDVLDGFRPSPGRVVLCRPASGSGLRIDTGVREGDPVPPDFDPLLLKLMAHGRDRAEALSKLRRAVEDSAVLVEGGATTSGFLRRLLAEPAVLSGAVHTGWVDEFVATGAHLPGAGDLAVLLAAIDLAERERAADRAHLLSSAARGRPELRGLGGRRVELTFAGVDYAFVVHTTGPGSWSVETADGTADVETTTIAPLEITASCAGMRRRASVLRVGSDTQVEIDGDTYRTQSEQAGVLRAPSASVVVQVRVAAGETVDVDDVLVVLESMKLELPVRARSAGVVSDVLVSPGAQVDAAQPLVRVEPLAEAAAVSPAPVDRISFERLRRAGPAPVMDALAAVDVLDLVRRCLLGFDVGPDGVGALDEMLAVAYGRPVEDPDALVRRERDVLDLFTSCVGLATSSRLDHPDPTRGLSSRELLFAFLRSPGRSQQVLPREFIERLRSAITRYGADGLDGGEELDEALYRLCGAQQALPVLKQVCLRVLRRWMQRPTAVTSVLDRDGLALLERLTTAAAERFPNLSEGARSAAHQIFVRPSLDTSSARREVSTERDVRAAVRGSRAAIERLATSPADIEQLVAAIRRECDGTDEEAALLQLLVRHHYRNRELHDLVIRRRGDHPVLTAWTPNTTGPRQLVALIGVPERLGDILPVLPTGHDRHIDCFVIGTVGTVTTDDPTALPAPPQDGGATSITVTTIASGSRPSSVTMSRTESGRWHESDHPGMHPATAERLEMWRLREFDVEHVASAGAAHLLLAAARDNPADRRLVALAEVRDLTPVTGSDDRPEALPELERVLLACFDLMRDYMATATDPVPFGYNRVALYVEPTWTLDNSALHHVARRLAPATRNLGLNVVHARVRVPGAVAGGTRERLIHMTRPAPTGMSLGETAPSPVPVRPLSPRQQKLLKLRRRGRHDPYEIVDLLTSPTATISDFPLGSFSEYDLDDDGRLTRVQRPYGENDAGIVAGVIENATREHPDGMRRVLLVGDPSRGLGALAEPECRRILAALALAEELELPVEWFSLSSGARISMSSGTENMDWVARVLAGIVEFTQAGGEINIIVSGVNVGAQPYFNAEATMLMHTRGILVMTPSSSMLLTGKEALDFAGGVSAEDNLGIGGYDRVMGPNGQAQYWAPTLEAACEILFQHYEHTYVTPGERFPRRTATPDEPGRDVCACPHPPVDGSEFATIGDIFSQDLNPDRKKPFDIRALMQAVIDQDCTAPERWAGMAGAESSVVWDAHLGGFPICLVGIESRPLPRTGMVSADGPESWTAATLFPGSSKKVARALNSASGVRPVVVLANLAGFDGSPESLRELQLEYGAEIGRAVTNFDGPIVFCVVSRYHGGAFVVFSKALNPALEVIAVRGARASVIGGSAAAAVVFGRDVEQRVRADERVAAADSRLGTASAAERLRLEAERDELASGVRAEVRAAVAREFDDVHTIERARAVGSIDRIISPSELRPALIDSVARGAARSRGDSDPAGLFTALT